MNIELTIKEALDGWKAAIDAQQPAQLWEVFTEDAIFQGLRPYSVGRQGVVDYYSTQRPGMTVDYEILQTRELSRDRVLGYVRADFAFPDQPTVRAFLGVVIERTAARWQIAYYQATKLD
ncbi:hypothetical protein BOO86_24715 [Mycobacterium sp. CBMA 234]|uniref:nuclear transport factor 2 family protein n=1 Tax=Mycolicibacterium sp. CBMA 234 TaxID=1918495 RepID=UPI0012DF2352|nr:nuclear transport factor 2 family protein [Mycolicibacterium sp. CBMA 234]MUL67698.1 hypothetical protein [Mycolicibacterium sp. CBMA 234]